MTSQNPYFETSKIRKKNHKKIKIIRFTIYFLVFLSVFLGIFFSIKSFVVVPHTLAKNYYIVYTILDAKDNTTAETLAMDTKARGGAGVVIKIDNKYGAVLAVYPTERQAKQVVEQLSEQAISAQITPQTIKTLSLSKLDENQTKIAKNIHQKYIETLDYIYSLSYQLDTNEITQSLALMRINELALLWEQRAEHLSNEIAPALSSENDKDSHPLYPTYDLALYIASQLKYLSNENTYQNSLKTLISVIRQTNYTLLLI